MRIYLDLLPKQRKSEIKRKKLFRQILREEFLFLLPLILFIVILLNIYYLISVKHDISRDAYSTAESQDKYQELSSYEEKFKQVNQTTSLLLKIKAGHLNWGNIFEKMSNVMPEGIMISDFSTKNYQVFLVGKSRNRDVLLNFKSELESNECFENINVPLSNLVVKEDIDFQMDFSIKKDCLKNNIQ